MEGAVVTMSSMLTLRPAVARDERRVLEWRNEPSTRLWSLTNREISPDDHHVWFTRKLADPGCILLIVEDDGRPVGQLRLDRTAPDSAEVSIGLAPEARGRGLGREALRLAAGLAVRDFGVVTLVAKIKRGNTASLKTFGAAGYEEESEEGGIAELRLVVGRA